MIQVFISYKHHEIDGVIAQKLYDMVCKWGFGAWMDVHNIHAGITENSSGWISAIDKGLRASQVLIGLISDEALLSENVQHEWRWAKGNNRRIFLIKTREFNSENMSHQFFETLYLTYPDALPKLQTDLHQFAKERADFTESVTVKERNLNAEILKDLDTLASQAPKIAIAKRGKHDPIIGGDVPTEADWVTFKDRIRRYWLESLLRPTLREAAALNIGLSAQPDMVIQHEALGEIDLSGGSMDVRGIFDKWRSFLIVGEAGAGKTVMLLQLATKLLLHPLAELPKSLPLLLNLSSWGNDDIPLEDWLLQEAETTYQIRKKTVMRWLADKQLILLLDGLDEIRADEADRRTLADRIQKINDYRQAHPDMPMVICTRINEYRLSTGDKAENKLDFDHAIKVDPLTEAQIQAYMDAPDLTSLRELYAEDAIVRDLAKIPFLLVTMTHTYRDLPKRQLEIEKNTIPDRLDHLFRKYLTKQLQLHTPLRHSEEKIREYLTWIATKTTAFGTVFRADKVTIEWFEENNRLISIYALLDIIVLFMPAVLFGLAGYAMAEIVGAITVGLLGMIFGATVSIDNDEIHPIRFYRRLTHNLIYTTIPTVLGGALTLFLASILELYVSPIITWLSLFLLIWALPLFVLILIFNGFKDLSESVRYVIQQSISWTMIYYVLYQAIPYENMIKIPISIFVVGIVLFVFNSVQREVRVYL